MLEEGYYWVKIHPIFEEGWTIGYYEDSQWYLMCMEGDQSGIIDTIGPKIYLPESLEF